MPSVKPPATERVELMPWEEFPVSASALQHDGLQSARYYPYPQSGTPVVKPPPAEPVYPGALSGPTGDLPVYTGLEHDGVWSGKYPAASGKRAPLVKPPPAEPVYLVPNKFPSGVSSLQNDGLQSAKYYQVPVFAPDAAYQGFMGKSGEAASFAAELSSVFASAGPTSQEAVSMITGKAASFNVSTIFTAPDGSYSYAEIGEASASKLILMPIDSNIAGGADPVSAALYTLSELQRYEMKADTKVRVVLLTTSDAQAWIGAGVYARAEGYPTMAIVPGGDYFALQGDFRSVDEAYRAAMRHSKDISPAKEKLDGSFMSAFKHTSTAPEQWAFTFGAASAGDAKASLQARMGISFDMMWALAVDPAKSSTKIDVDKLTTSMPVKVDGRIPELDRVEAAARVVRAGVEKIGRAR